MSRGTESKETIKRRNAKPERAAKRSVLGNLYQKNHPERYRTKRRERYLNHKGDYAKIVEDALEPITIRSDNIILSSDRHIPFHDEELIKKLFAVS